MREHGVPETKSNLRDHPSSGAGEFTGFFPVIVADIAVGMNAFASFIAYVSVAFVQKILTSLNSTLPQRGQAVSVYSSSRACIDLNRRFIAAIGHLNEIIGRSHSLSDSRQWYPSPAWLSQSRSSHSLDRISLVLLAEPALLNWSVLT